MAEQRENTVLFSRGSDSNDLCTLWPEREIALVFETPADQRIIKTQIVSCGRG
jgi:hypothetical protein